jgi:predicted Zn-dependent protease
MPHFVMFLLLPGRVISWAGFMFPRRGDLWASARRKDSIMVHALFSALFWAGLAFVVAGLISNSSGAAAPAPVKAAAIDTAGLVPAPGKATLGSSEPTGPADHGALTPGAMEPSAAGPLAEANMASDTQAVSLSPEALTIASISELDRAVRLALSTGRPQRWKSERAAASGYAVASEEQGAGETACRNVYFTTQRTGQPDARSPDYVYCRSLNSAEWAQN